jgi:hypothetical protein
VRGERVIDAPWVQSNLARCLAKIRVLELMTLKQAWGIDKGILDPAESSAIKVFGSESFVQIYKDLLEASVAHRMAAKAAAVARQGAAAAEAPLLHGEDGLGSETLPAPGRGEASADGTVALDAGADVTLSPDATSDMTVSPDTSDVTVSPDAAGDVTVSPAGASNGSVSVHAGSPDASPAPPEAPRR